MCQCRGMLVVQGTLLCYGYGVQCGRYGVRCCRCMPMAQGMPCRVLGTFEVGRSQWRIGTLFFTVSFIVINMPTSLSQGYSGNRRICNHKFNLCSHKRGLQSQFQLFKIYRHVMVVLIQSETVFRMAERFG